MPLSATWCFCNFTVHVSQVENQTKEVVCVNVLFNKVKQKTGKDNKTFDQESI